MRSDNLKVHKPKCMKKHGHKEGDLILPDKSLRDDESERTELTCLETSHLPDCLSDPEEQASTEKVGKKRPPQQLSEELKKEVVGKPPVPLMQGSEAREQLEQKPIQKPVTEAFMEKFTEQKRNVAKKLDKAGEELKEDFLASTKEMTNEK